MNVGVIARSEDRGLGLQSWEVTRHLKPERVLLVEPQDRRWPVHRERYDDFDTTIVRWDGRCLDEAKVRAWLSGLDVVYTAETPYDWQLPRWAYDVGCAVVVHANPEMLDQRSATTRPVTWWAATDWRLPYLPFGTRVVPMPVATDRFPPRPKVDGPVTFVHSAGHEAMNDRNGTRVVVEAVRDLAVDCRVVVFGQDGNLPKIRPRAGHQIDIERYGGGVANYWDQYVGDVLLMPRRYGGLCLPVQEALAAGMAVVMSDVSPNRTWPGPRVPVTGYCQVKTRCGQIDVHEIDPADLRAVMERLATDRTRLAELQAEAVAWAAAHSWEALLPTWEAELARACRRLK